jgi:hypothetical protein
VEGVLASLRIPDRYKSGLAVLTALPDDVLEKIITGLGANPLPQKGTEKELSAWVSSEAKGVSLPDLQKLVGTLVSLYRLRVKSGVTPDQLALDVAEAASKDASVSASPDILQKRLARLLTLTSFNLSEAKAKELQLEAEHGFCEARIITDLRPVFGGNISDSPEAMIIVHTLKLGYHDSISQTHKEMYIALDADDIAKLAEILKRSEEKTKTLKEKMNSVGIRVIDLT